MFASQTCLKIAVALLLIAIVESRYVKLQDIPITPEGTFVRIVIKEDVKAGQPVASMKIVIDDVEKKTPPPPPAEIPEPPPVPGIPVFEDRLGIDANDKCAAGRVRIGSHCIQV